VSWEVVCRLRSERGLGVIDLTLTTCALCYVPAPATTSWDVFVYLIPLYRVITTVHVGHGRSVNLRGDNWTSLCVLSVSLAATYSHMVRPTGAVAGSYQVLHMHTSQIGMATVELELSITL
jgi:hypothetical protein